MSFNILEFIAPMQSQAQTTEADDMRDIDIYSIQPSDENFYDVSQIKELADAILQVGLMQNLVVEPNAMGTYELISGHRRRLALVSLVESGHEEFKTIKCKVIPKQSKAMSELRLILANSTTRVLSEYEKMQQTVRLKAILTELKAEGTKLNGHMRDIIADSLSISKTKVAQLETVSKNLPPEYQEDFKAGKINFTKALKLSQAKSNTEPHPISVYDSLCKMPLPQMAEYLCEHFPNGDVSVVVHWLTKGV